MAAAVQNHEWNGVSRRRVPRFESRAPIDVTVMRSGVPDTVPGRAVNLCERGIAAMLAGELAPGDTVRVDLKLSPVSEALRATATVRYHDKLRCGFEFVSMSPEQKAAIRDWARGATTEVELRNNSAPPKMMVKPTVATSDPPSSTQVGSSAGPSKERLRTLLLGVLLVLAVSAAFLRWRWNRSWEELESGIRSSNSDQAQVQVPTDVMQKLLVHKVEPLYPAEARTQNVEGIIALDIVVSRDGSVVSMHPLNGPDILARAAEDALRWWKFSPYRVNGQPVVVETTMAVEFKR